MASIITGPIISEIQYCETFVRNDTHQHNEYEIIYVIEGEIEITINNVVHRVSNQSLIFLSNLENHSIRQLSAIYRRYYVTLNTVFTDTLIHNPDILNILKNHNNFPNCVDISTISNSVTDIFQKLLAYDYSDLFANELASNYLSELLIYVLRIAPHQIETRHSDRKQLVLSIQTYIDVNFRENIRIENIAKQFYISKYHMSHLFNELTGYSPKQYLTTVRLKNAAVLLVRTNTPIKQIATECGFSDINNFIKQFKKQFGFTPNSFRTKYYSSNHRKDTT